MLRRLSFTLPAGSVAVLLGENGSGKSTLLRLIAGLSSPSRGTVTVFGDTPYAQRRRIAYVSHAPMLYDELSATENLRYFASLSAPDADCGCSGAPEMALRAVGLDPNLTRPIGQYSQGMRQRTALARALHADPDLLLLDEPFSNLDVKSVAAMLALLADFRTWSSSRRSNNAGPVGRTVLFTTHQPTLALPLADTVLTLSAGSLTVTPRTGFAA